MMWSGLLLLVVSCIRQAAGCHGHFVSFHGQHCCRATTNGRRLSTDGHVSSPERERPSRCRLAGGMHDMLQWDIQNEAEDSSSCLRATLLCSDYPFDSGVASGECKKLSA
ncbi:hypothetical protein BJ166DRAFT_125130 [Pestalotiopsis sp. NC0098]|nr:hypothetical protein BJ166DRAFT_125130 [Pestalotiopsis sp. NC0098]